jgi:hypothetical protein
MSIDKAKVYRDAWGQLPKCQPGDMPGDTAEEITRLKAQYKELVEAAEKALPEMICTCTSSELCGRCNLYDAIAARSVE